MGNLFLDIVIVAVIVFAAICIVLWVGKWIIEIIRFIFFEDPPAGQ